MLLQTISVPVTLCCYINIHYLPFYTVTYTRSPLIYFATYTFIPCQFMLMHTLNSLSVCSATWILSLSIYFVFTHSLTFHVAAYTLTPCQFIWLHTHILKQFTLIDARPFLSVYAVQVFSVNLFCYIHLFPLRLCCYKHIHSLSVYAAIYTHSL